MSKGNMNLNKTPSLREKVMFVGVLLTVLYLFYDYFWTTLDVKIIQAKSRFDTTHEMVKKVEDQIDLLTKQIQVSQTAGKKHTNLAENVKQILKRRIVDINDEINATIQELGSANFSKSIQIKQIKMGRKVEEKNYLKVPIVIDLTGRYTAIRRYFESIEKMLRPVIIDTFSIEKNGMSKLLSVNMKLTLYLPKL